VLDDWGWIPGSVNDWILFSSSPRPDRLWGLPSVLANICQGPLQRSKAAGGEANHSPPSSVEVKNAWCYTSTPNTRPHGMVLS